MDPFVVSMEPEEEMLIGNMVVTNTGDQAIDLSITGAGPVLRRGQIIDAEQAVSPALRIYHLVTAIYVHPPSFPELSKTLSSLCAELVHDVPTMGEFVADVGECMAVGDYRGAHEKCLDLLAFEQGLEDIANNKG